MIGALLGFTVVGVLATLNQQLGALGGYSAVYERASGRTPALGWKAWFLVGILAGSLIFRLLAGATTGRRRLRLADADVHGRLGRRHPAGARAAVLIGFGAKLAGGCTAGNGISGTSLGSPASFVATGTFLAVAIAGTFFIDWVIV